MEQEAQAENKAARVLDDVAQFLNAGGKLMVITYDLTANLAGKTASVAGKAAGAVTSVSLRVFGKAKNLLTGGFGKLFGPNEKKELETKVNEYEEKIKKLYYEIGKEGASAEKLESEKAIELIGKVRDYEREIRRFWARIAEIDEMNALRREEAKKKKHKPAARKAKVLDEDVEAAVRAAIDNAVKHGVFDSDSQREVFRKIANDLLDEEMEVRILQKTLEALRAITGEEVSFDPRLKGRDLANAVNVLKEWWQNKRIGKTGELPEELIVRDAAPVGEEVPVVDQAPVAEETAVSVEAATDAPAPLPEAGDYMVETSTEETAEAEQAAPDVAEFKEEDLKKKLKSDLLALCRNRGLECDETFTKADLIAMLTSKK